MNQLSRLTFLIVFAILSSFAQATTIQELASGPPKVMETLGRSTFVPFDVVHLTEGRVAYMDYDWFREKGVVIPPEGLRSDKLNRDMLDAFGWMTPGRDDLDHSFNKSNKRTMYAYYYGGDGLGGNVGSGRSASMSYFDLKGLATPLIKSKDVYHSNGAALTIEAIDEAIWSRILESETHYGANRVVAVIFTGTYVKTPGDEKSYAPRALIVREMGLRPAHFMINWDREKSADEARVQDALKSLLESLPYPKGFRTHSAAEAIRTGVLELTRREAIVQAEMYAKRLYFGSNSPSNLEITGRRLDLGDHTAQAGYTKIIRIDDESPFGETDEFKRIQELVRDSLSRTVDPELKRALPTKQELAAEFDRTWDVRQKVEMIKLAGVPNELAEKLASAPEARALGQAILDVAQAGNTTRVMFNAALHPNTSTYDLGKVLTALVNADPRKRADAIAGEIRDATLRAQLVSAYENYLQVLVPAAQREGVSRRNLDIYQRSAVEIRNRTRTSLFRGDKRWKELWSVTDQALQGKNGLITQDYVENEIAQNRQNFKDAAPFELVLEDRENAAEGWAVRKVFDAKTGLVGSKLRINVASGQGYFGGRFIPTSEIEKGAAKSGSGKVVAGSRRGSYVEFMFDGEPALDVAKTKLMTLAEFKATVQSEERSTKPSKRAAMSCRSLF